MNNHWNFVRLNERSCAVKDKSGQTYHDAHGDLAAHDCQDFMRWTQPPSVPGGRSGEPFALKPSY